jgi:tetratricopeptide (TPR) repeat protein
MFSRAVLVLVCIAGLMAECKNSSKKGRYISENDTSYSQDIRDISAKINKEPGNAELYYRRGNAFYYQKRFKDALIDFETATSFDSLNAMYHFRSGECILQLDSANPQNVMKRVKKAVELKPDFNEAKYLLARLYMARQQYDDAEKIYKELKTVSDYSDKAWFGSGQILLEKKDSNTALKSFENALQANPQHYASVMQMATVYLIRRDPLCLKYFDRAIAINEFSDEAHYGKGFYKQMKQQWADAIALYDQARTINPTHKLAIYNTAVIERGFDNYDKSMELCDKLLEMDANFAKALALRGDLHEKKGNKKAAKEDYLAALRIDPNNEPAKTGLKSLGN